MADLAVWTQVVWADQIPPVDLGAVDELVDLDGPGRLQRHVLELFLRHLDEGVGIDLIALDDVLVGDLLAGVGIDFGVLDTVAGLPIQLVEGDLFGFRGGRIERDGTGDERKAKEAFPVGARGHGGVNSDTDAGLKTNGGPWFRQGARGPGMIFFDFRLFTGSTLLFLL